MTPFMKNAKVVQNAYIVANLEQACEDWHRLYGIGPFRGGQQSSLVDVVYRGAPAPDTDIKVVFVQSGDMNIELIELCSDGPSAFHDMYKRGEQGFHHTAVFCEDYEAERDAFVDAGFPVAAEFTARGTLKICYVDTRPVLGHMIELYPESDLIRGLYAQTIESAQNWDGKDLIIPW